MTGAGQDDIKQLLFIFLRGSVSAISRIGGKWNDFFALNVAQTLASASLRWTGYGKVM